VREERIWRSRKRAVKGESETVRGEKTTELSTNVRGILLSHVEQGGEMPHPLTVQ